MTRLRKARAAVLGAAAALAAVACGAEGPAASSGAAAPAAVCGSCAEARRLMAERGPAELAASGAPSAELAVLAAALAETEVDEGPLAGELRAYLTAILRARAAALAADPAGWTEPAVAALVDLLVVDPERYAADRRFRERLLPAIEGALGPKSPAALRELALARLATRPGFDFDAAERVAFAWGSIARSSRARELPFEGGLRVADSGPVELSVYALTSEFFTPAEAEALLAAVRRHAPGRSIAVLADRAMRERLGTAAGALGVELIPTRERPYTPWPRDPVTFLRDREGRPRLLLRPYRQRGREEDALMGRLLIQGLPRELDRELGEPAWSLAPIPFHNGHILVAGDALWISIHTLERRALELLGIERVPVESFTRAAGVERYLAAIDRAADELAGLYGLPARFVHPLPRAGSDRERAVLMGRLGGGAGFDLDSVVTVLPEPPGGGPAAALVGDPAAGAELVATLPAAELATFRRAYGLAPAIEDLRERLAAAQGAGRAPGLAGFLDLVARDLERQGLAVARLPLLLVPTALLESAARYPDPDFLVGWNNVVVEPRGGSLAAEAFRSGLSTGDRTATRAYAGANVELALLPPLVESVRRNGGYRCASNHLRANR